MEVIPRNKSLLPISTAPALVWCPHPLMAAGRHIFSSTFLPGESIASYIDRVGLDLANRPVALYLNDSPVPRNGWAMTFPNHDDIITVRAVVQGGGGDGNKALRTILTIAVLVAAPYAAPALGLTGVTATIATGLVTVGGMMMVNAILPPPSPELDNAQGDDESPTYSLGGGGNRARVMQPMPLVVGQHRIFPDLGAREYTEFEGKDQYLYGVYNYGLSDMTLSDHRIGDTPLLNYSDVDFEQVVGGQINLFPENVDTLAVGVVLDGNPEILGNGDFSQYADWTYGTGWTYRALTGDAEHDGSGGFLSQGASVFNGREYYLEYSIKSYTQGSIKATVGSKSLTYEASAGLKRYVFLVQALD